MRLVIGLACALLLAAPAAAQEVELELQPGETLLQVEAEGVARSRPDVLTVTAGVSSTGATAAEALQASNVAAERVLARVRALGVSPQDIRTNQLSVRPRFAGQRDEDVPPRILGYVSENRLELRLRDLSRAGDIVSAAFEAGANNVDGPSFTLSDDRPQRLAAAREGVRRAREEAENYAQALGMRISRVLRVTERGRVDQREEYITVTGSRIARTPVEPGEVTTGVRVWVDFALAPR
jgi:hypothetical protein